MSLAHPFLKWPGGKRDAIDVLMIKVPRKFKRYHEPFNVPYGCYSFTDMPHASNLRACSRALQGVAICQESYVHSMRAVDRGDFVFVDSPYVPIKKTSHVAYTVASDGLLAACPALPGRRRTSHSETQEGIEIADHEEY